MGKKDVKIATGVTQKQLTQELKEDDKNAMSPRCYICKRRDGDESVFFDAKNDSMRFLPTKLDCIEANVEGNLYYRYWICYECVLLFGGLIGFDDVENDSPSVSD